MGKRVVQRFVGAENVEVDEDGEVSSRRASDPFDPSKPFEAIASTEVEARDGDIVELSSLRLNRASGKSGWVPLLADHDMRSQVGLVRVRRYKPEDGGPMQLRMTVRLFEPDTSEKTREIHRIYQQDPDRGFSISWGFGEWIDRATLPETDPMHKKRTKVKTRWGEYERSSYLVRNAELLEVSTTPIPSDTTARPVRSEEDEEDLVDRFLEASRDRPDVWAEIALRVAAVQIAAVPETPPGDAESLTGQDQRGSVDGKPEEEQALDAFFGTGESEIPSSFWENE